MFKKLLAVAAMLFAVASFAAVEVNKATAEELDTLKGIGPVMAKKIVDERKKGEFKNWDEFVSRVKGTGGGNAAKLSAEGLTVNGQMRAAGAQTAATTDKPGVGTEKVERRLPTARPSEAASKQMPAEAGKK